MSTLKLVFDEIRYRKLNFLLSLAAVMITALVFLAGPTLVEGYKNQTIADVRKDEDATRKIMLELGFNVVIVHEKTEMDDFWSQDFSAHDLPQSYVDKLADSPDLINVRHLVARLKNKIQWQDRSVLLVGELPEVTQKHFGKKKPMGFNPKPGTVQVGYELQAGLNEGDEIEVLGRKLKVAKLLPQSGTKDDITLAVHLDDAQAMLDKPQRVNEILALGCECAVSEVGKIREQLRRVLPDTKVLAINDRFLARAEQRQLMADRAEATQASWARVLGFTLPVLIGLCAIAVGLVTLANVRERRAEIGLLRALGKGSGRIAALFLGKAALIGFLGGLVGVALGYWLARLAGERFLAISGEQLGPNYLLIGAAIVGAPLVCAAAAWLPTLLAVRQDPAIVLRDA